MQLSPPPPPLCRCDYPVAGTMARPSSWASSTLSLVPCLMAGVFIYSDSPMDYSKLYVIEMNESFSVSIYP